MTMKKTNTREEDNYQKNKIKRGDFEIVNFLEKEIQICVHILRKVMAMVCCDQIKTIFKKNVKDSN